MFNRENRQITRIDTEQVLAFEREIKLPFPITLQKTIQELTGNKIQATNENNEPLYKTAIEINETGEETFTETTEQNTPTQFESQTVTYKIATDQYTIELVNEIQPDGSILQVEKQIPVYTTITNTIQNPISWVENSPIMIPEIITRTVTIENEYMEFNAEEVTDAKIRSLDANSLTNCVYFSEEMELTGFNSANVSSGNGFAVLHKNGELISHIIPLFKQVSIVEIYLESQEGIITEISPDGINFFPINISTNKGRVKLSSYTNKVFIKFTNPTIKNLEIYAIGVMC